MTTNSNVILSTCNIIAIFTLSMIHLFLFTIKQIKCKNNSTYMGNNIMSLSDQERYFTIGCFFSCFVLRSSQLIFMLSIFSIHFSHATYIYYNLDFSSRAVIWVENYLKCHILCSGNVNDIKRHQSCLWYESLTLNI